MAGAIKGGIIFALSNFPLTFFVIGLIASGVALSHGPATRARVLEKIIVWHVFWAIGISYFYNFVMHVFFGQMSAAFIGWANSPFQFEVGTASLGFAVVAFLAAFRSFDFRLAAVTGPAIFSLGAAVGHIHQMVVAHNFAPGNAGVIFYMDILIPLFGWTILALQSRERQH